MSRGGESRAHEKLKDGRAALRVYPSQFAKRELQRIMAEPGNRDGYRRRKCTVEPVFGKIEVGMGFRRFLYRGRLSVGSEWNLVCAALNIKKRAALCGSRWGFANRRCCNMFEVVAEGGHSVGGQCS